MKRPKPKFHRGQVVALLDEQDYAAVDTIIVHELEDITFFTYKLVCGSTFAYETDWGERFLRPLTKKEAGR